MHCLYPICVHLGKHLFCEWSAGDWFGVKGVKKKLNLKSGDADEENRRGVERKMDLSSLGKNRKLEDLGIEPQNPSVRHPFADKDCTSHIMMVDDEKLILNAMRRGLEMVGLRISSFTRGTDALKAFRQAPDQYDLVITDLRMPEMDGCSFAREILEIRPNLPVILCSGSNEQIIADEPLPLGIKSFMTKPIRLPKLRREIRKLLRLAGKA